MNDCPRQNPAYRSVSLLHKTRFGGFLLLQGGRMNDCPRRYIQKKAAYRSVSPLHKTRRWGVYEAGELTDKPGSFGYSVVARDSAWFCVLSR